MNSRFHLVLVCFLVLTLGTAASSKPVAERETKTPQFDSLDQLEGLPTAAAAVTVMKNQKEILARTFGFYDGSYFHHTNRQTIFNMASVSKQFTAAAVLLLEQRGLLSENDPLTKFFPDLPHSLAAVHLRHLIHHTSGLKEYTSEICNGPQTVSNQSVVIFISKNPQLGFEPGTRFEYSNTGYALLAIVVEKVTGISFPRFLEKEFFQPSHMLNTFVLTEEKFHSLANRAVSRGLAPEYPLEDVDPCNFIYGDGTLGTTIEDYPKWIELLESEKVFSAKSRSKMFESVTLSSGEVNDYAYGWIVVHDGPGVFYTHSGGWLGYRNNIVYDPGRSFLLAIFATSPSLPVFEVSDELQAVYSK